MRWRALLLGCALTLFGGSIAQAQSSIATEQVPTAVTTTAAVAAPQSAVATPQPLPSGLGVSASDWSFQEPPVAAWLDSLAAQLFGAFGKIMNTSVQLAQALFLALATAEFGWAACRWAFSPTPLEEVVAEAYFKALRMGLIYVLIGCTFTVPGGGPGWFPLIVGLIIGMAQQAAGVSVMPSQYMLNGTLNLTAGFSPGDVFTFFWNIAIFIIKAAFAQQSLANIFVGAFTGATAVWMVTAGIAAFSGLGVMILGVGVSFKYFLTMFKAYLIASQAYLQGFLGSSITASNGSGLFNAALNLGIEMGALIVIMGVFKSFLTLALNAMALGFLVVQQASGGSAYGPGPGGAQLGAIGPEGVRLVAVLLLDVLVVLWAYAVKTIPEMAAHALSGRLDVRPGEFLAHASAMSTPARALGAATSMAGGALGVKVLGGAGAGGGAPTMADRAKSAATGAMQGALFAGAGGAVGGALMGAMSARSPQSAEGTEEGRVAGGGSRSPSGASSSFANREFAPKGATPTNPTPAASADADASTDAEHDLGAGASGGRSGSAKRGGSVGGTIVDGATMRVSHGPDRLDDDGGAAGAPSAPGHEAADVPHGAPQSTSEHVAGAETRINRSADRVTDAGASGGADAGGRATDAAEAAQGYESSSTGGHNDTTTTAQGGDKQGQSGGTAQGPDNNGMRDLTSALRDNTAALRAHRFGGGGGGGASAGSGGGSGDAGGGADPIFGGGSNAMNPLNLMMYRKLLGVGAGPAPRIQPEHPSASVDAGSLVR